MKKIFLLSLFCFTLVACQSTIQPATLVDIRPLASQVESLTQANADLRVANERLTQVNLALQVEVEHLKSVLRADAEAGKGANERGWLPFERYVWNHQLALLPVAPDQVTVSKWAEAGNLYASGGEAAMQEVIRDLQQQAGNLNDTLGHLREQVDNLTKERDESLQLVTAAEEKVRKAEANLQQSIQDARAAEAAAIRAEQVKRINQGAMGCGALAILLSAAAMFSPVSKLRLALLAGLMLGWSATLLGLARWLGSIWFEATLGAIWGFALVAGGVWLIRRGLKEQELHKAAAQTEAVSDYAAHVVNVLNEAEKSATVEEAATLKKLIWEPLKAQDTTGELDVMRHDLETFFARKNVKSS